ncbi:MULTISPECIES: transglutaminase domain-containing protein [Niastella]|uniref:Transglutaminase domain-containing protein n=1 Tax=Niastella soli TaxID=2821487 RepID=A0ABS3Z0Y9_9BACT|nr:transglutaminase domain-containing protein [Niastella soli]MBO9203834.1 transglutaminase domain-containing protein [Niastella soli]
MKITILLSFIASPFFVCAQLKYPPAVESALREAGANRSQLETVLRHYKQPADLLKLKAACFLIEHMPVHRSCTYYWADSSGKKIQFNELDYPDITASLQAFERLKKNTPGIHPVSYSYRDIDSMKATYLINNIDMAFATRQKAWAKNISFKDFCEYVLPYRASVEPLQTWRQHYMLKYAWISDSATGRNTEQVVALVSGDAQNWFANTYGLGQQRREPLPRLGALQLLHRKAGACEDIADLMVFALRSQGFLVTNDMVTCWATSFGTHFFNSILTDSSKMVRFDAATSSPRFKTFAREPAKVIRTTYSRQPNCVASIENIENIPDNFLRTLNYKDVTNEFWPVRNVKCALFHHPVKPKIAYACVLNQIDWNPAWWGKVRGDSVVFTNMCQGAVFLPVYCNKGKLIIAGYPVASGYQHVQELRPDTVHYRTIHIKQQEKYLMFRPGKQYSLYYWDNTWRLVSKQTAPAAPTNELVFDRVPRNALLILIPEYSQKLERPFTITDSGERMWW